MNATKIQLSKDELILVENAGWILTKNTIIRKVYNLFGALSEEMKASLYKIHLPEEVKQTTAKISKGENYKGLPYVVLDYPRLFTRQDSFAIRTLFWWANYFSVTLHLKGVYKELFIELLRKNILLLSMNDFYIGISEDEWQHGLDEDNYISLRQTNAIHLERIFKQQPFLKLSAKINFHQWNQSEVLLLNLFTTILQSLQD